MSGKISFGPPFSNNVQAHADHESPTFENFHPDMYDKTGMVASFSGAGSPFYKLCKAVQDDRAMDYEMMACCGPAHLPGNAVCAPTCVALTDDALEFREAAKDKICTANHAVKTYTSLLTCRAACGSGVTFCRKIRSQVENFH